jgi:hypothetical protein
MELKSVVRYEFYWVEDLALFYLTNLFASEELDV